MILERLQEAARRELHAWAESEGWKTPAPIILNETPDHVPADISIPWPLAAAKGLKRRPLDIAAEGAKRLATLPDVEKAEAAPPGFINITLTQTALTENLTQALASPGMYGRAIGLHAKKYLLEFVSANPTGPVHLASGRAATLGDSLARILSRRGHEAKTENYINDAGRQVELLGLSVAARHDQRTGKDTPIPENGYQGDYIKDIAAAAPKEASSWKPADFSAFAVERMLDMHREDMKAFGVEFDLWFRESELHKKDALNRTLAALEEEGRVYKKDDAIWLGSSGDDSEDDKDRVLIRSDKRPTYFLADLAYHQDKRTRGFDELIDIWGADHHGYVPRMKEGMAALGLSKDSFHIIIHQLVHLFRGREAVKMSKRAGTFVTLRELVEEVGVDACRFFFAMRTPNSHLNFDIELAKKRSQENPVYYVQYVHARCSSIFREAKKQNIPDQKAAAQDLLLLTKPTERALLLKLARFPEVLRICETDFSPHPLPTYLMELAGLYHQFYEQCRCVDQANVELTIARMTLCAGVRALIREGLSMLGVSAPESM